MRSIAQSLDRSISVAPMRAAASRGVHPRMQVQFSPFEENKVAIATAQHFGIVGNGRLVVAGFSPTGAAVLATCVASHPRARSSPPPVVT